MSTILKALRRLEEDDAQQPTTTPSRADVELRDRILAEEAAAETVQSIADARRGFSFSSLSSFTALLPRASRTLTPIALGVALLLFVGAAFWYWTGGAGTLEPSDGDPSALVASRIPLAPSPALPRAASPSASAATQARPTLSIPLAPAAAPETQAPALAAASVPSSESSERSQESEAQPSRAAPAPVPVPIPVVISDGDGGGGSPGNGRSSGKVASRTSRDATGLASASSAPTPPSPPLPTPQPGATSSSLAARAMEEKPKIEASAKESTLARNDTSKAAASPPPPPRRARPTPAAGESRPAQGRAPVSASSATPTRAAESSARSPRSVERIDHRGLPDVSVTRTVWHPTPSRRSAKVRLESTDEVLTLHEGDAVGGLVVQEITPSSVVFSTGDVEIRRRVGQGAAR